VPRKEPVPNAVFRFAMLYAQGVELFRVDLRDGRLNVETALQAGEASETGARA
jgi:hypothetical protein